MTVARLAALVALALLTSLSQAEENQAFVTSRSLSAGLAQQAAGAAMAACRERGYQVAVAVTDRYGNLLAFVRDPLAGHHTIAVSQRKAYTAATYQSNTIAMQGRDDLARSPGVLLLGGGVPIRVAGHFYGAIAVSGAPAEKVTGDVDQTCAEAGIDHIGEALEFAE